MNQKLFRSYQEPIREGLSYDERWKSHDKGCIICWEVGRELSKKEPELAERAKKGELPLLGWKGGVKWKIKKKEKYGCLKYLAQWQGLRGDDLKIDLSEEIELICSETGMKVIFTGDAKKYAYESVKKSEFIALDIETANANMASICQIGIAKFVEGEVVGEMSYLINPEEHFNSINIHIHGITEEKVAGCSTFPEVAKKLSEYLDNKICVSHTHFDRVSLSRALTKYRLKKFDTTWLDSAKVARRAWTDFAWRGYGLANVCDKIGYKFKHHDALEDAKASGHVLLAAIKDTGIDLKTWLKRVNEPIDSSRAAIRREVNSEGALYGEVIVFTGSLDTPRKEAADIAASIGCSVAANVTQKTSILVVGDQDVSKLAGKEKSSKHLKAEQLISEGQNIRIIKESDFKEVVRQAQSNA